MILSDVDIREYLSSGKLVIDPLSDDTVRENGVDLKIGDEVVFLRQDFRYYDPEEPNDTFFERSKVDQFVIPAGQRMLLVTKEYIRLPNDLVGLVNLRSSFARLGIMIPPTVVDAGFEGQLTIEVVGSSFPIKVKAGQRFLHLVFAKTMTPVAKPYNGKYQGQKGVTLSKV